jgi:hypothetical protein
MQALVSIIVEGLAPILHGLIESLIDAWRHHNAEGPDPDHSDPAGSGA